MRGGADPALRAPPRETDKVYTWFAIGVAKVYTGTEMFTSEATKQQKKFTLLQNKFEFQPNKFAFWQNKFIVCQNKFTFRPKKVYILVNKFTTFIKKLPKSLHKVNHANLVNFSEKFTPLCPPMKLECQFCRNCTFTLNPFFNIDFRLPARR